MNNLYNNFKKCINKNDNFNTTEFVISHERKFLYIQTKKAGSATINNILTKHTDSKHCGVEDLNNNDYTKFCVVRNPWDRMLSCYLNKIRDKDFNNDKFRNGIPKAFEQFNCFYANMTFQAFLEAVEKIDDYECDPHFRSQYISLGILDSTKIMDLIIRFENFKEDLIKVFNTLGVYNFDIPTINKTNHGHYSYHYSEETKRIVSEKFKKDIKLFNYSF